MIERSLSAKSAKSVFFEDYNDIDIFIEDTAIGYRKIFKEILIRAFNNTLSIDQVFPLGSRTDVIEECKKNQQNKKRKQLYIIDGDLHLLCNTNPQGLHGLYILPRYCIENYFLDKMAILDVIYEEDPNLDKDKIEKELEFENWIIANENLLVDLFIHYALCFKNLPSEPTVSYKVTKLCSNSTGVVSSPKIATRIGDLKTKLISILGEEQFNEEYNQFLDYIKNENIRLIKYVSGKDYLMPLITARIQKFAKFPTNDLSVKIRLAKKIDVTELYDIKNFTLN